MGHLKCFVTVGSTQFDELIESVLSDDVLARLKSLGINQLTIQFGAGRIPIYLGFSDENVNENGEWSCDIDGIKVVMFRYRADIKVWMSDSDLIIGHAGAGTCLEALEMGKPMVAVINDTLMDNHQSELPEKLAENIHLLCTTPNQLAEALKDPRLFSPTPFPKAEPQLFANYMQQKVINQL